MTTAASPTDEFEEDRPRLLALAGSGLASGTLDSRPIYDTLRKRDTARRRG